MVLTRSRAQAFYDRFGKKQDTQAFYENAALDDLISHAEFGQAAKVFEFGCGTGSFALRLLQDHLSSSASYLGIDVSQTMITLAEQRIAPYTERAKVVQSDGSMRFPLPNRSVERVISTYVFDLLSEADIREALSESHRVLLPDGKLCLAGLTPGTTLPSRMVCAVWSAVFRLHASLVGGCRPIRVHSFMDPNHWSVEYLKTIVQFGVPSEVLIARPKRISHTEHP